MSFIERVTILLKETISERFFTQLTIASFLKEFYMETFLKRKHSVCVDIQCVELRKLHPGRQMDKTLYDARWKRFKSGRVLWRAVGSQH